MNDLEYALSLLYEDNNDFHNDWIPQDLVLPYVRPRPNVLDPRQLTFKKRWYGAKRLETVMETCSICLSSHKWRDGILTNCGHCFGRVCYEEYHNNMKQKNEQTTCPLCRSENPSLTIFDERKTLH